jgi:hypothetical protein
MHSATNMAASARLALIASAQSPEVPEALVFECPPAAAKAAAANASGTASSGSNSLGSDHRLAPPSDPEAHVIASRLTLVNTLLASALQGQQARFITDCSAYMQVSRG